MIKSIGFGRRSCCILTLLFLWVTLAPALEPGVHSPFLIGVTNGIELGELPPSGFYVSDTSGYLSQTLRDKNSNDLPVTQDVWLTALALQYVWNGEILGARFSSLIVQPGASIDRVAYGRSADKTSLVNTIITPLNLSWAVADHLHVPTNLTFYPPDVQYRRGAPINGNNFWTIEPNAALTYDRKDFEITAHIIYDLNTANSDSPYSSNGRYTSGDEFVGDYTGAVKLAAWRVGLTGFFARQTEDDTAAQGAVLGRRFRRDGIGPQVSYSLRHWAFSAYYLRDLDWQNIFGGSSFWLRATYHP
jgi:hypothetical protein